MPPKVSVIVPVYNPGSHIDDCIRSILGQTMPAGEVEAIFVDDGSTDGTGERLDRLAAEHEHVTAIHIPNSGWPGRPRNIGMDAARGEFFYFVDNDDWLAPDALERLHERAQRDRADIVIGKIVGHRRSIARELFRQDRTCISVRKDLKLLTMLTPHKLFRADLIRRHGLRYPEGRRRLEDHVFVLQAYFATDAVSVLSDYPIYHWVRREDETNASSVPPDRGYWENLDEVLDLAEANSEPGAYRDRLLAHWYRTKVVRRVDGQHLAAYSQEFQEQLLADIREVVLPRFSPAVGRRMDGVLGLRDRLVRANRLDGLQAVADVENAITAEARVTSAAWEDGVLCLDVEGTLNGADGTPLVFPRQPDGRLSWPVPDAIRALPELAPEDWDVTTRLTNATLRPFVRERAERIEYMLPSEVTSEARDVEGGATLLVRGRIRFDAATAAGGAPLRDGIWDLSVLVGCFGLHVGARLGAGRRGGGVGDADLLAAAAITGPVQSPTGPLPPRAAIAYATVSGNATVDLGGASRKLTEVAVPALADAAATRGGDAIDLDIGLPAVLALGGETPAAIVLRRPGARDGGAGTDGAEDARAARGADGGNGARGARDAADVLSVPATVVPARGGARLRANVPADDAARLGRGRRLLELHLGDRADRLPLALEVTSRGAPRLVRVAGEPAAHPLSVRLKRALLRVPPVRSAVDAVRG